MSRLFSSGRLLRPAALAAFVFFSLLFSCPDAFAQRQTPGRVSLEAWFGSSFPGEFVPGGGGFSWNKHDYLGHVSLGIDVDRPQTTLHGLLPVTDSEGYDDYLSEDRLLRGVEVSVIGGYHVRLLAPRSRTVILSAGLSMYNGLRVYSGHEDLLIEDREGFYVSPGSTSYSMGFVPELQFEVFPFRNASLYLSARPRIQVLDTFASASSSWFTMRAAFGIKYYL